MASKTTQLLLIAVVALLAANLVFPGGLFNSTKAHASEQVRDVIKAREFQLVSPSGKVVAQIYLGDDGGGQLRLRDGKGTIGVKLGATTDGS